MPGIQSSQFGLVSRALPQAASDAVEREQRFTRYGANYAEIIVAKEHVLADEGTYFVANNSGTGIATTATPTAFSDTAPFLTFFNTDTAANTQNKRIYLSWIRITETAAGTAGTDFRVRIVLDTTTPSGGTVLTPVSPNNDTGAKSLASVRLLGTGVTQSGNSRVVVGTLQAIPSMTAPLAALSEFTMNFGGLEVGAPGGIFAAAGPTKLGWNLPPIIIGPQQCCMVEFLITSQSAASSWTAECGWWER